MLAVFGLAGYALYNYRTATEGSPHTAGKDPRTIGPRYARDYTADRQTLGPQRTAMPIRHEQHPSRGRIAPLFPETPAQHATRMKRLAESLPEGPFSFSRKTRAYDRLIETQRLPIMHPGLTRVGNSGEHRQREPMWSGRQGGPSARN